MTEPTPSLLERSWQHREEALYLQLFGDLGPGIAPLDAALFQDVFKQDSVDPRWLQVGVFACPPHGTRTHWVYVTSGLTNGWEGEEDDAVAGLGMELLMETEGEAPWALATLQWFAAYQLLLASDLMPGGLLEVWQRLKLGIPVDRVDSDLQALVFIPSPAFGGPQSLPSGTFQFLQLLPHTLDEHAFGREHGFELLLAQLQAQGAAPVVDPRRAGIVLTPPGG